MNESDINEINAAIKNSDISLLTEKLTDNMIDKIDFNMITFANYETVNLIISKYSNIENLIISILCAYGSKDILFKFKDKILNAVKFKKYLSSLITHSRLDVIKFCLSQITDYESLVEEIYVYVVGFQSRINKDVLLELYKYIPIEYKSEVALMHHILTKEYLKEENHFTSDQFLTAFKEYQNPLNPQNKICKTIIKMDKLFDINSVTLSAKDVESRNQLMFLIKNGYDFSKYQQVQMALGIIDDISVYDLLPSSQIDLSYIRSKYTLKYLLSTRVDKIFIDGIDYLNGSYYFNVTNFTISMRSNFYHKIKFMLKYNKSVSPATVHYSLFTELITEINKDSYKELLLKYLEF